MDPFIIIGLLVMAVIHLLTFIRIWKYSVLNLNQERLNTGICILLPFIWNLVIFTVTKKSDGLHVITKNDRKINENNSLNNPGAYSDV